MKPDGPTMSTEEIARWEAALKQRVVAQREHKAKYKGQPGTPHTIRPERNVKAVQRTLTDGCRHRWRLEECNGSPVLVGTCGYCGATREFRASYNEEPVPMRKMRL